MHARIFINRKLIEKINKKIFCIVVNENKNEVFKLIKHWIKKQICNENIKVKTIEVERASCQDSRQK